MESSQKKLSVLVASILVVLGLCIQPLETHAQTAGVVTDPGHTVVNVLNGLTQAATTSNTWQQVAVKALEQVAMKVADKVAKKMIQKTINWASTGFNGNPFYVRNQSAYLQSVGDQQVLGFLGELSQSNSPYARTTAQYLTQKYTGTYTDDATFTLQTLLGPNWQNFTTDFTYGGWDAWEETISHPGNQPREFGQIAAQELNSRITSSHDQVVNELLQNKGFLGVKKCVAYKNGGGTVGTSADNGTCQTLQGELNIAQQTNTACTGSSPSNASTCQSLESELLTAQQTNTACTVAGQTTYTAAQCQDAKDEMASIPANSVYQQCVSAGAANNAPTPTQCQDAQQEIASLQANPVYQQCLANGNTSDSANYTLSVDNIDNCARYETTTPGAIVEEQLSKSLLSPLDTAIQKGGSGNPIIDSVVDLSSNLISQGIEGLISDAFSSNTSNKAGPGNNTSGYTNLFTPTNTATNWSNTPDANIAIEDLNNGTDNGNGTITYGSPSADLQKALDDTNQEVGFLEQTVSILQAYPTETQTLDQCLPGPDKGWKTRLETIFNKKIAPIERVANKDKDNKRVHTAQSSLQLLQDDLSKEEKNITDGLEGVGTIPSAPLIYDRISKAGTYSTELENIQTSLNDKRKALSILQEIADTVKANPTKLVNGQIVVDPNQGLSDQLRLYSSIKQYISTDDSVSEAKGQAQIAQQDSQNTFNTSNPHSLLSQCYKERSLKIDVDLLDKADGYLCGFNTFDKSTNNPSVEGAEPTPASATQNPDGTETDSTGNYDPTTVPNATPVTGAPYYYVPTGYGYTYPWETGAASVFTGNVGTQELRINCSDFYNSRDKDYQVDTYSN